MPTNDPTDAKALSAEWIRTSTRNHLDAMPTHLTDHFVLCLPFISTSGGDPDVKLTDDDAAHIGWQHAVTPVPNLDFALAVGVASECGDTFTLSGLEHRRMSAQAIDHNASHVAVRDRATAAN